MFAAFAITKSSETRSERNHALAANDNAHLHLVANNAEGTCPNLSRSPAFLRLTSGGVLTYDALGNMQSKTVGPRNLTMSYDSQNRLTAHTDTIGSGRSLGYDTRGNVTQLGSLFFTYDMSDQPTYISGSANGTYRYDGNLKRVKSTVDGKTIYNIYDAGGTLIHIDAVTSGKQTDYIGKVARVTNSADLTGSSIDTITYLHADQLGSANTGSDDNGNVLWREQYTPFGITLTSPLVNNDQAGFTGHIKDSATGLNYMQARYYDPLIGRFLSRDPIGFTPERPEMFGSYTYVGNDPINITDPTGMIGNSSNDHEEYNDNAAYQSTESGQTKVELIGIDTIGNNSDGTFSQGHAFVQMTDTATGHSTVLRGGDEGGTSGGTVSVLTGGIGGGDIKVDVNPASQSVDTVRIAEKGLGAVTLGSTTVSENLSSVTANAQNFADAVNGAGVSYNAYTRNSNSVAGTGFEQVTGQARPTNPPGQYNGYNRDLCSGDVTC